MELDVILILIAHFLLSALFISALAFLLVNVILHVHNEYIIRECDLLSENGYVVKIETIWVSVLEEKRCFIMVNDKFIPYERYVGVD